MFHEDCGAAYQEADATITHETCACGTFAIGHCQDCTRPVCGSHSSLTEGVRVCVQDARKRVATAHTKYLDESIKKAVEERELRTQQEQQVARFLAEMAARGNPGTQQLWRLDRSYSGLLTRPAWKAWDLGRVVSDYVGEPRVGTLGLATDGTWLNISQPVKRGRMIGKSVSAEHGKVGTPGDWQVSLAYAVDKVHLAASKHGFSLG